MRNLGKWIGMMMLGAAGLHGAVTASVDDASITMGDTVTYTLTINGDKVQKPSITSLCGVDITNVSQGTSMKGINGKFTKEYLFSYTFTPTKDCTIDPVELEIDGVKERSEAVKIRVVPMQITKDTPYMLAMRSDKPNVRVGEPFKLTVTFKQRHGSKPVDWEFIPPKIRNFWIKEQAQSRAFEEGDYTVTHVTYVVAAQKPGTLGIDPAQIKIATRTARKDAWGMWLPTLNWRSYFSNGVEVSVDPLPEGVDLVGTFTIEAVADKQEIDANEAVNVTVTVKGSGNFEDIKPMKPTIDGVTVFDEEPKVDGYIEKGTYMGFWKQKLALVAERGFTVPSFSLRYFDTQSQRIKTITTDPIAVTVRNEAPAEPEKLTIERAQPSEEAAPKPPLVGSGWGIPFAFGVIAGLFFGVLAARLPWTRWLGSGEKGPDLKDDRVVLQQLLPHRDDPEIAELVDQLENNLYGGTPASLDRRKLKAALKTIRRASKSGS